MGFDERGYRPRAAPPQISDQGDCPRDDQYEENGGGDFVEHTALSSGETAGVLSLQLVAAESIGRPSGSRRRLHGPNCTDRWAERHENCSPFNQMRIRAS